MYYRIMEYVADEYKRQVESRRMTSIDKRVRSLQKEDERLQGIRIRG